MAITQDRMISIIDAARRAHYFLDLLQTQIRTTIRELPPNSTPDELLQTIQSIQFLASEHFIPTSDRELVTAEYKHFQLSYRKNQRSAAYARRKSATGHSTFRNTPIDKLDAATAASSPKPSTLRPSAPLTKLFNHPEPTPDLQPYVKPLDEPARFVPDFSPDPKLCEQYNYKPLDSDVPPDPDADLF